MYTTLTVESQNLGIYTNIYVTSIGFIAVPKPQNSTGPLQYAHFPVLLKSPSAVHRNPVPMENGTFPMDPDAISDELPMDFPHYRGGPVMVRETTSHIRNSDYSRPRSAGIGEGFVCESSMSNYSHTNQIRI